MLHPPALSGYGLAPLPISFAVISAKDCEASKVRGSGEGEKENTYSDDNGNGAGPGRGRGERRFCLIPWFPRA